MKKVLDMIRSSDWWEYKLPPMLAFAYLIIDQTNHSIVDDWFLFVAVLFALIVGATYVSLLNDATDIRDDELAGKKNQMAGFGPAMRVSITMLPLVIAGCLILGPFRSYPVAGCFYVLAYVCFTLYSLPPFRLKKRGLWGVFADALGSQVFPLLFIITYLMANTGQPIRLFPLLFASVWACCFGLRGILWHQFSDLKNDTKSGMKTIVGNMNEKQIRLAGASVLAVELTFLTLVIIYYHIPYVFIALAVYAAHIVMIRRNWNVSQIIVRPAQSSYRIFMFEFYQVYFPFTILIAHCFHQPTDAIALVLAFIFFYKNATRILTELCSNLHSTFSGLKIPNNRLPENTDNK